MERGVPLTVRLCLLLVLCLPTGAARAETRQLVLVASVRSPAQALSNIETRMLFLGYTVNRGPRVLRPVRNVSTSLINNVFLQHVVAMSQAAFDRRILLASLQKGRPPPLELATSLAVAQRLVAEPLAVSYLWLTDVQSNADLKVLRVLWVE
jgi:hypothetical protein